MNGNSDQIRSKLSTKIVNTMLAIILVLGLSPLSKASASVVNDSAQQNAEQAQQVATESADSASGSASDATGAVSGTASAASGTAAANGSASGTANAATGTAATPADQSANSVTGGGASGAVSTNSAATANASASQNTPQPAAQNGNGVAVQANEYNPDAESREVTQGLSVTIYKDKGCNDPLGDEAVSADTVLYGKVNIDFSSSEAPTLACPNIAYKLPADQIDAPNQGPSTLYDSGNNVAGTWSIKDGVAYLKYNEDWLRAHSSNMTAHFSFDFTLADSNKGDGSQTTVSFPRVANGVTIKTKDGNVDGNKFGASPSKEWETPKFDASDNSYTWTIRVSPSTFATNLTIDDEIGSNLEYVSDSFKLVDANGNQVAGTCSASIDGKKAAISLGDLSKGTYYVQYKTTVSSSALSALKDNTQLENVGNKATWTWGKDGQNKSNEVSRDPQKVKYNMVSKSSSGTSDDITWTVELNAGDLKADMSNYAFSDTLGAGHSFKQGTQYEVKDASGATIASGPVDPSTKNLQVTLPSNVGKQKLTVTYHTTMDDASSKDAVSNKVEATPPASSVYPKGEAEASYQPDDNETYITKKLTDSSTVEQDGYATWSSTINFTKLSQSTDPTTIVFYDKIEKKAWTGHMTFDNVVVSVDGTNQVLSKDTDYALTKNGQYSEIEITFKNTDLVKSLLGANGHDVIVSYRTHCDISNDVYTNTSSLKVSNVDKGSASDSYAIDKAVIPEVSKWVGGTWWDANYYWGEGEAKGAWITSWNVAVNKTSKSGKAVAAADLKGQPIVVKDTMDKGMVYVDGSAGYNLIADNNSLSKWQQDFKNSGSVSAQDGKTVFTIPTDAVTTAEGSTKAYAELWYRTAVKPSSVEVGTSKDFSNTAEAKSGETVFPSATSKTTVTNNVLEKTSARAADDSHVTYTIKVNPNALDLNPNSDSLTLTDVMDSGCSFTNGSLRVTQNGNDITNSISYSLENTQGDNGAAATKLTLTVPDSASLVVTYDVAPQGALDDEVVINNTVSLNGFTNAVVPTSGKWRVQKSNAGTEAQSYGITVRKTDDTGKMPLKGAQFSLYKVDLDKSTANNLVTEPVSGNVDVETNLFGVASFGSKDQPLDANVLYYYVETKAPSGYEITNPNPTYVMFSGTSAQDKKDYAAALEKAQALGINPSAGTSFSVYDKKKDETQPTGSAMLSVQKKVNSGDPAADQSFDFSIVGNDEASKSKMPEHISATTTGVSVASFGKINFTKEDIGKTYVYTIKETSAAPNDGKVWTMARDVTATVTVGSPTEDAPSVIPVSVAYSSASADGSAALFNNTFKAPDSATAQLKIHKTVEAVEGSNISPDEKFTFELYKADENGDKTDEKIGDSISVERNGEANFEDLSFDAEGTCNYVIHEVGHDDHGWVPASDVKAQVVVGKSNDGARFEVKSITYNGKADECASFVDTYKAKGTSAQLGAKKLLDGAVLNKDQFQFQLKDADGKVLQTKANDGDGKVTFDDISYDKAGEYVYSISEVIPSDAVNDVKDGITYDPSAHTVKVVVTDGGQGQLHASVKYDDSDTVPVFTNKYTPATGSFSIDIQKTVNGSSENGIVNGYAFSAAAMGDNADQAPKLDSIITGEDGKASFVGSLAESDMGKTYRYEISETSKQKDGWTNALSQTVEVKVSDHRNAEGKIDAAISYPEGASCLTFNNTYTAKGSATLSVVKQVNGEAPAEDQAFDFALSRDGADADSAEAPLPEQCTATTNGSASASFGAIEFTKDDIGKTYHYVITETSNLGDGWTKADPVKVTVSVGEPSSDNLASIPVSVSYGDNNAASQDGSALFNNTYREVGGSFSLALKKSVEGKNLDRSFDFAVEAVGENADNAPRFEQTVASSDESGNASFGFAKLTAENKGKTYTYKISETSSLGAGWTKAADVYAKVAVSDSLNNEGDYWATVSYSANKDGSAPYSGSAQFANKYQQASGSFGLDLVKTVNGKSENVSGFWFKATSDDEGAPSFDEQVTDAEGKASFKFDGLDDSYEGKEFTYTISEDLENGKGWTKAADVAAKVQIGQRGDDNKFHPTVTYEGFSAGSVAAFNNTYTATGSAVLSVIKKVNGAEPDSDAEFEFALSAGLKTRDAPLPSVTTCKTIGSKAAKFGEISYSLSDAGKTYEYRIHETTPATVGWTMAGDVIAKVTVGVDNGDGTLKPSTVEYVDADNEQASAAVDTQNSAALFNNQYQQASGKFQLGLTKTVNGGVPLQGETFKFSATSSDEGAPTFNNVTTDENGEAKFAEATLSDKDAGKTYTYRIHEVSDLTDGSGSWTKAPDVIATVQVSNRTDNNELTATVTYKQDSAEARSAESAAVFNNEYQPKSVSAPIEISKTVNGGALLTGESFTFQLTDNDGKQIGEEKTISGNDAEAKATFTTPDLTEPGEYTYWVKESSSPGENWTNDEPIKVVVKVGTEGKRDLKIESVKYFRGTEELPAAVFNNTHADKNAEAFLKVSKTVNGAEDKNLQKQFEFQLQPKNNAPMPEGFDKATVTGTSSVSFSKIVYDKAGAYNYVIHESSKPGPGWKNAADVNATVEVGYADNGRDLVVKSIEYNNQKVDAAAFDNAYEATGQVTLSVVKQVNGKDPMAGEKFQFALTGQNGAPMPAEGVTCETVGNALAQFGSIPFTLADAGKTYTYTISEVSQGGFGWKMADPVTATVTVGQDSGDGTLSASTVTYSVSGANGEAALFNNIYTANTQVALGVHKTVQGGTDKVKDESFDFELHEADEQGNMTGEVIGTVSAKANETKSFNPISYTTADAGKTFTYWIHEVGHNDKGWTADKDAKVTVKVSENADRSLATEVAYDRGASAAEFANTYATSGQATLSVLKTVNGGTDEGMGQKFHFDLYNADDQGNAQGEKISSVEAGVGEKASFGAIDLSGEGTYHYVIKEAGYNDGAWFAAGDVVATVTAADNGDGTLNVSVKYSNADSQQDAALFDNAYAPATATIQVKKTVNGEKAPADTHFTFELQPQDGAPMPEEATADTFGGDTCSFGDIEYTQPDTYRYVIHETANLGEGWTNAADVPVTVKVVRDGDARTLKVESVDYGDSTYVEDGQTMALFDNKYVPSQPEGPGSNTPEQQQPAGGASSDSQAVTNDVKAAGVKTGDNLMVVGGAIAVVAVAAAAIAAFALRRRKH